MIIDIALVVLLLLVCAIGLVLTVLQLPGTWLLVVASLVYAWYYDGAWISYRVVMIVAGIAVVAEIIEVASGAWMGRRGGASRRAAWLGLIGGIAGALMLTVPVPVIGTIVGAMIGCFAGAMIGEITGGRSVQDGTRSGIYTAMGRALGSIFKLAAATAMSALVVFQSVRALIDSFSA